MLACPELILCPVGRPSFKLAKSFTPIYTGGSIAVSEDGQRIYTTLNEEVVCTDVASGERIHLFKGVSLIAASPQNLVIRLEERTR